MIVFFCNVQEKRYKRHNIDEKQAEKEPARKLASKNAMSL